ncbi:hypothetical protein K458DRAFT_381309 [Lentithecium fluviatile CBS 122367]|uniref:Uncharacterized protein n=1 Tax=Lentithecium fluviatile CBS 122367 TaxID=1168545 RepID=A0A6G1JLM7_9PLEO|nr:hypothetical protein K458DRAFT_381309 [Lentithecium fluviatile CBS 122367]
MREAMEPRLAASQILGLMPISAIAAPVPVEQRIEDGTPQHATDADEGVTTNILSTDIARDDTAPEAVSIHDSSDEIAAYDTASVRTTRGETAIQRTLYANNSNHHELSFGEKHCRNLEAYWARFRRPEVGLHPTFVNFDASFTAFDGATSLAERLNRPTSFQTNDTQKFEVRDTRQGQQDESEPDDVPDLVQLRSESLRSEKSMSSTTSTLVPRDNGGELMGVQMARVRGELYGSEKSLWPPRRLVVSGAEYLRESAMRTELWRGSAGSDGENWEERQRLEAPRVDSGYAEAWDGDGKGWLGNNPYVMKVT